MYVFLRRSNRKIRYFAHDLKADTIIIDDNKIVFIPGREDSLNRMEDEGVMFATDEKSVGDIVIGNLLLEQLHKALAQLSKNEWRLIEDIFFLEKFEEEMAETLAITQQAVNKRKKRVLIKLKRMMEI